MPNPPEDWGTHEAFLRSRPSAGGLRAMADAVARGAKVERVRRLGGGLSSATSAIRLRRRDGRALDVVLKRFRRTGAREEWRRLRFAQTLPVPTPEPLALDARGEWFGTSAFVMSRLPGRADVAPRDVDRWLEEIARAQIAIHLQDVRRVPASLREPLFPNGWKPRPDLKRTPMVDDVVATLRTRVMRASMRDLVVAHRDSHPGNLLWARGRISGVADWRYAGVAPRAHEVAYMRADIAVLLGVAVAERYRETYERVLGERVRGLAVWDLLCGLDALHWNAMWVEPYREQGADLTQPTAHRRALAFVRASLSRIRSANQTTS